jgi:Barrel-sandwich domain of CusB or HlyD membrane-fusion
MKKKILAFVGLTAVLGGGAWLLAHKSQRHAHETGPIQLPVVVEARLLSAGHTRLTLPVVVDVQALRDSMVASRLSAYVTALPLYEGEHFKRGDLLLRLDMTPSAGQGQGNSLNTELAAAESTLKTEQERLRRAQALYEIQGVSLEQVQLAEALLATARSRHTIAKENLRGATVSAPFDGVVSQRLAQPGDWVTPGKPLLKITDTSAGQRLLVNVPDSIQPAGLRVGEQMLPLTAWPEAGPQGLRRYEARSQDGALLPGSRIDAKLVVFRSPHAVLLPHACLLNDDGHRATLLALKGEEAGEMRPPPAEHKSEHPAQQHKPHDDLVPMERQPPATTGGHHQQAQTASEIEIIRVTLAAQGEEGAVATDAKLAGRRVICASPDILSRLVAGAPFALQTGQE